MILTGISLGNAKEDDFTSRRQYVENMISITYINKTDGELLHNYGLATT